MTGGGQSVKDADASGGALVRIRKSTADRVAKRLGRSSFKTVDEYVDHVLNALLDEVEGGAPGKPKKDGEPFSKEEQEAVEQSLRSLGYM